MAKNSKTTSPSIASQAAKTLGDPNASATAKKLAASALSQVNKGNQTGSDMETVASKVLNSPKYSDETKDLAASILSQSNKDR
ncbi:hypothetical protein [Fibrella forsythiae]|uniref:Anti-sigma-28 factor FlgM C-terminal domain-containing protein n=1 Tax=Fibrella forsythiae TaxID=2817061 RepID=A0ABS3JKU5_9BACT|nr:hypothetical protein [Fibrella forsythiae]MBO0950629.1 hypothetical protein [Fibrella forsythiae]